MTFMGRCSHFGDRVLSQVNPFRLFEQGKVISLEEQNSDALCAMLAKVDVHYQRQPLPVLLDTKLVPDTALIASIFAPDIQRLKQTLRRNCFDVVNARLFKDSAINYRDHYLSEHVHQEDEIRWFLSGTLLIYINLGDQVPILRCRPGDLVRIPAGVPHWIDMGPEPDYCCVNFYNSRTALVNEYTGSYVAESIPRWENIVCNKR